MIYEGFTPHPKQRELINGIIESKAKYHIASIGRQFGKSLMGINLALYWAINHGPAKILWISPIYSQTTKVHKEIMLAIGGTNIVQNNNYSSNEILLRNGSTIMFRSAERYDNIRGLTLDYVIIDEAAFIKDDAYAEAIKPTLLVRGKKVLFISTPKGKNWFYNLYQLGLSPDYPNYVSYAGSSYDTPYIDKKEIEDAQRTIPKNVFQQEYLAQFIDSGGEVFTDIDTNTFPTYTPPEGKIFCGIDLGKQNDYTVATFIDSKGKVVDIYRNNRQEWTTMTQEMLVLIRKWNATVLVEVNSIGDVIFEQVKKAWSDTHPFVTSSKSKNEIIEGLILDFNNAEVKIPSKELFPPLYSELSVFTYEYNPKTRNIRYGHPAGLHDDTVISLAIANYNRKQNKTLGTYAVMGSGNSY
jgi:phage FluMu gp28-like protein